MKWISYYWNLLKTERSWIAGVFYLFLFAGVAGFMFAFEFPQVLPKIIEALRSIVGDDASLGWGMVWSIFRQNLQVCLIALFGGILFGLVPIGITLTNGLLLGYVVGAFPRLIPTSFLNRILFAVLAIAPHGILEIPIILIAAGFGLRLGFRYTRSEFAGQRLSVLKQDLLTNCKLIPLVVVGLALAALLEVFLTGTLLGWYSTNLANP